MNIEDLPADLRKKVYASLGSSPRKRLSRKGLGGQGTDLRCHSCGLVAPNGSETTCARHTRESGHGRWDVVLP